MENVKRQLDAWRDAERRRDGLALDSAEWQAAEDDARTAAKVFHAEEAQATVRHAEAAYHDRNLWSAYLDRRTSAPGGPVTDASPARSPQR